MSEGDGAALAGSIGWRRRAACTGEDLELFFPFGSDGPPLTQVEAKAICARCPVREACLRYAVTTGQGYGIWGGLIEDERRGLRYPEQLSGLPGGTGATLASTSTGTARASEVNPSQNKRRPKHGCTSASHTGNREALRTSRSMPSPPPRTPRSNRVPSVNTTTLPESCAAGITPDRRA